MLGTLESSHFLFVPSKHNKADTESVEISGKYNEERRLEESETHMTY